VIAEAKAWQDLTFSARDGLRLYGRCYPAPDSGEARRPLVCLPGLTRNSRDFHDIAMALSRGEKARSVYTLDLRGRGLSEYDPDPRNYSVFVEMLDVQDYLVVAGLERPAVLGTSRGGLIAMALAAAQPNAMGAVILNDIGPVIEVSGLARIAGYAGRIPTPLSWEEATELVAGMSRAAFPAVPEAQWAEVARQWFNEKDGRPAAGYDPAIARSLAAGEGPPPALWHLFKALANFPLLVLRGENSDILAAATLEQMRADHPACSTYIVPGQGHAPLLKDDGSIGAIRRFLDSVDALGWRREETAAGLPASRD
jgi:pimeloyl-ACP methyl ester carboxylesterase